MPQSPNNILPVRVDTIPTRGPKEVAKLELIGPFCGSEGAVTCSIELSSPEGYVNQVAVDQDCSAFDIAVDGCNAKTGALAVGCDNDSSFVRCGVVPVGRVGTWSAYVEPMGTTS